jgi:probable HAF family extracellular repeat protein
MRVSVLAGLIGLVLSGTTSAGSFTSIEQPGSQLVSLSEHGRIATGSYFGEGAFRWTRDRGVSQIEHYNGMQGMNSWGQPLVGQAQDANQSWVAAIAYSNAEFFDPILVGGLPGATGLDGMVSAGYDAADDGTVVGLAYTADNNAVAFRWHAATGISELPRLNPDNYARANAISRDGHVVIGWNDMDDGYRRAVKWVDGQVSEFLDAGGLQVGEALGVNRDGSVIVGTGAGAKGNEAWRWTAATGVQSIGIIGTGSFFDRGYAFGVSDDGTLVGGASGAGPQRQAVVWTPQSGMILLTDFLAQRGIAVPAGWSLNSVTAVSGDGLVLGGWGIDPNSAVNSFVIELDKVPAQHAIVEARGTIVFNDVTAGPFAGVAAETPVTMTFRTSPDGIEIDPGRFWRYPIDVASFTLQAGAASDTLITTQAGPYNGIANDYPRSDGIHIFESPLATAGTSMEFELFNPGGDLFDSTDLNNINRTFTPEMFEKASWVVSQNGGEHAMVIQLDSVTIEDECSIFCAGFEAP